MGMYLVHTAREWNTLYLVDFLAAIVIYVVATFFLVIYFTLLNLVFQLDDDAP